MKRKIAFLLAIIMSMVTVNAYAQGIYEASDWAKEELTKAEELKLIPESFYDTDFRENIDREEFTEVVMALYENVTNTKYEVKEDAPFDDTESIAVASAYELGFVNGTGDAKFSPFGLLTREQSAAMLTRVYKKVTNEDWTLEKDTDFPLESKGTEKFSDDEFVSDWAKESVYFMAENGVIKGIGENEFAPEKNTSKEQAVILALRMVELIGKNKENTTDNSDGEIENPDPYMNVDRGDEPNKEVDENTYTVAFIGGSLTAGGGTWINKTQKILEEKMLEKKIVTINAGKGGTTSVFGAARFSEDVGKYNPDMVFVEFAVNDAGLSEKESKIYMESIVRQCKKLAKEPVVVFLYAPFPVERDSDRYKQWEQGIAWKEELAKHYGIKSINVYDYMQEDFEKTQEEKGYETFTDYLKTMYTPSGTGFDVHGGYPKYAEAIVKAFSEDYEGCISPMKNANIYCAADKKLVEAEYSQIFVNSERMNFAGDWKIYTKENQFTEGDSKTSISYGHYSYPYFTEGIAQVINDSAAFGFDTKASAFSVNYPAASAGSSVKVFIDQKEVDTLSCYSTNHAVNYNTKWVALPNDGKTHRVIMLVDKPTADNYIFRFGSVMERYTN